MQENTNLSIAVNTIILYVRLAIVSVCGLLYTRFSMQALGVDDYGLFSVVACIITFVSVVNTIMVVTSNRFLAVAIGRGNMVEANRQFCVNLIIHVLIAVITIVLALPLGHCYIANYVNYTGNMSNVVMVYDISVYASAVSFIGVPFNGLLMARERFFVFCSTDVLSSLIKLVFTYLLIDHFEHKLLVYALVTAFMTAFPTFVFIAYCRHAFRELTRFVFVRDWKKYREVLNFSVGIGIGAISMICKTQGGALLINTFFSTTMNAGLAVANSVSNILQLFANNVQKSISPQIVKNYASENMERCTYLVCLASKITYLTMLFVSVPFLLVPEFIFGLWLAEVPPYAVVFTRLLIADLLLLSINAGISDFVFATGRIKFYQCVVNFLLVCSVVVGYMTLKHGMSPQYLFYVYIFFSFLVFAIRPVLLVRIVHFNVGILFRDAYLPAFAVSALLLPVCFFKTACSPFLLVVCAYIYFVLLLWVVGLKPNERAYITNIVLRGLRYK